MTVEQFLRASASWPDAPYAYAATAKEAASRLAEMNAAPELVQACYDMFRAHASDRCQMMLGVV